MKDYKLDIQIRWSDLDPNFHLRHSVYYDWGALCRINYFNINALDASMMQQLKIGPILFREEAVFKKEIRSEDKIFLTLKLLKAKKDFSRWSIQHEVMKNENILSAILTVDGAWMNIVERKLTHPTEQVADVFNTMPKAEGFEWI
ncbi:MAG TPA: acyl-CoA thioesterase [Chitinophagaceae bacterium]|jgi:acyl-CoA thioester hydrolase|nr:acyl-CoA thioesterase [Chitinophagaceae bacterium]